jgi:hypothetical protein
LAGFLFVVATRPAELLVILARLSISPGIDPIEHLSGAGA